MRPAPIYPRTANSQNPVERPSVPAPVDQFGGIVLASRCHHLQTGAEQDFLLPFHELLHRHRRAAFEVYGEAKDRIREAGSVKMLLVRSQYSLKVSYCVWQRSDHVGRPAKEAKRMVIAQYR